MPWCADCYTQHGLHVQATHEYEEDPLCASCVAARQKENGEEVSVAVVTAAPPPAYRWNELFKELAALPLKKSKMVYPDNGQDIKQFRNNLRSALAQNKKTMAFKWSLKLDGQIVRAVKVGLWKDSDSIEATHEKQTHTVERKTVKVVRADGKAELEPKQPAYVPEQITVALEGGFLTLSFEGELFAMPEADRRFVFSLVDRMRAHDDAVKNSGHKAEGGEKLYAVLLPLSFLQQMYDDCANDEERAAVMAAYWRNDPAIKPLKLKEAK